MITVSDIRSKTHTSLSGKWGLSIAILFFFTLVEFILAYVSKIFQNNGFLAVIYGLFLILISVPISYGLIISFIKLKRNEYVSCFDFLLIGLSEFSKAWSISLCILLKLIIPIILYGISFIIFAIGTAGSFVGLFVSGLFTSMSTLAILGVILIFISGLYLFIKGLSLVFTFHISYDNPNISAMEACNRSIDLMQGYKWTYFLLQLSYSICIAIISFIISRLFTLITLLLVLSIIEVILNWILLVYTQISTTCFYDELIHKNDDNFDNIENQDIQTY